MDGDGDIYALFAVKAFKFSRRSGVIKMSMGENDARRNHLQHVDAGYDVQLAATRIDYDALLFPIRVEVAVGLHRTYY